MELHDFIREGVSNTGTPIFFPSLEGTIDHVKHFDERTGECELEIRGPLFEETLTLQTRLAFIYPGQTVQIDTPVFIDPEKPYKRVEKLEIGLPKDAKGLRKFLRSGAMPGIGPKTLRRLIRSFPENFFEVLEEQPQKLTEIKGIGKRRKLEILDRWKEYKARAAIADFLFLHRFPLFWMRALWENYGAKALPQLKERPYHVSKVCKFDFEIIDPFARQLGFDLLSTERLSAGLHAAVESFYRRGHCAYPEKEVLSKARVLLKVFPESIENALEIEIINEHLVLDTINGVDCIFTKTSWDLEKRVADSLLKFNSFAPPTKGLALTRTLDWAQRFLSIQLGPLQKKAIEATLSSPLTIITGGPGTGKTTLIRSLVKIWQMQKIHFALCSPTGRGAKRLGEATGFAAQTLHRLLWPLKNKSAKLNHEVILIDEASMLDLDLFGSLLRALPPRCSLILVGDSHQIPSVGAGTVLKSLIGAKRFEVVTLTHTFRQEEGSFIRVNAERINRGLMPLLGNPSSKDFHYLPVKTIPEALRHLIHLFSEAIPKNYGIANRQELQVLTPINQGPLGTIALNEILHQQSSSPSPRLEGTFKLGDKVMVKRNNYRKGIFNGDIGYVSYVGPRRHIRVDFDERETDFIGHEAEDLALAYATSIHKSQGSEYRGVIVILTKDNALMAQRHLLYTAITRGKEQVFLIADPAVLQNVIQRNEHRWEKLTERLKITNLA